MATAEAVKELYDKMLHSINVMRSAPPNAWHWSLIENCKNHEDIKLLFDALQNLRRFVSFASYGFTKVILIMINCVDYFNMGFFGCRGCRIFVSMKTSIAIFVGKLPRLVFMWGPSTLVCD